MPASAHSCLPLSTDQWPLFLTRHAQACAFQQAFHFIQRCPIKIAGRGMLQSAESVSVADRGIIRFFRQVAVNKSGAKRIAAADAIHNLDLIFYVVVDFSVGVSD